MAVSTVAPGVRRQAVEWLVEARSGAMNDAQHAALAQWRQADPTHETAWAQVSGALDRALEPLAPHAGESATADAALGALLRPPHRSRRRLVGGTTLALAAAGATGLIVHRFTPLPGLLADAHTATAERRTLQLADGSRLLLDARTAVDIDLDAGSRRVHLRRGALIATVAADAAGRPFAVYTPYGEVAPEGAAAARCMVRLQDMGTQVAALTHPLVLRTPLQRNAWLPPGRSAWMQASGTVAASSAPAGDLAAWERGMLAVQDGTLDDVVQALRPYRRGFIRLSPAAAPLRVLGAFPLDDTDHTLQALADTLPITITHYQGGWMTVIDHA